jgi:hypothetical protein
MSNWRDELAAMQRICEILDPLPQEQRVRVIAAVICMFDDKVAASVVRRWQEQQR